ncbi:MAG: hypothetical protein QM770_00215 [Tepidisphaeraceae bacterium]
MGLYNDFVPLPGTRFEKMMASTDKPFAFDSLSAVNATGLAGLTFTPQMTDDKLSVYVDVTGQSGDATLDAAVNFSDLLVLASNYGTTAGATWLQGDFTGDGAVNFNDLLELASHYGIGATGSFASDWALAQAQAPEPTTLLLLLPAAALQRRRSV